MSSTVNSRGLVCASSVTRVRTVPSDTATIRRTLAMLDRVTPGRWASAQNPDIVVLNVAKLTFLGAARTVTGSKYLLEHGGKRVLFDCGLFPGLKELRLRNWDAFLRRP